MLYLLNKIVYLTRRYIIKEPILINKVVLEFNI
jgi:hypothetical protein